MTDDRELAWLTAVGQELVLELDTDQEEFAALDELAGHVTANVDRALTARTLFLVGRIRPGVRSLRRHPRLRREAHRARARVERRDRTRGTGQRPGGARLADVCHGPQRERLDRAPAASEYP